MRICRAAASSPFRWLGNFLDWIGGNGGRNVFAGGLALSALVLPIVIITASEALRAVPRAIREGALGVGATQWETVRHHVLPAAAPGILTGTMLALARAAGEAAPILLVGAATGRSSPATRASSSSCPVRSRRCPS